MTLAAGSRMHDPPIPAGELRMPQPASEHSQPLAGSGQKGMSAIDFSQVEDYCGKPAARKTPPLLLLPINTFPGSTFPL